MAIVITSYTPTTGDTNGGTSCTVTGTGLDVVDAVFVGNTEAEIVGTPTATSLTFKTPAADSAGNQNVTLVDVAGDEAVTAADPFVYTTATTPETLVNTLANKWGVRVRKLGDTTWTKVRGLTTAKPGLNYSTEDDSDFESGIWQSTFTNGIGWSLGFTVKRGRGATSGNYDPGQQIILAAHDKTGSDSLIEVQWYDRSATSADDEAYQGTTTVEWAPQGGNKTSDKVDVTLNGQGARTKITNPVIGDPTLAAGYGSN